jgi:hypothetical protein
MSTLQSKVLCVNLKKSCLGTSFVDPALTNTLETETGAQEGSVKGSKNILLGALKPMRSLLSSAGKFVRDNSLPGISNDLRIVTPAGLTKITTYLKTAETEMAEEVADLQASWDALIEADRVRLDKAFDANLYPPKENLAAYFGLRLTVCDLPQGDYFRVEGLTEDAVAKLKADHAAMIDNVKAAAKNDLHKQLLTAVTRIAEGLDKEDISKLHNTTFTNLQELLAKVPDLNITNDPMLEELRKQAEASLNYQMDQVKKSAILKEQAQEAAKAILATYGGGVRRISMPAPAPATESSAA